MQEAQTRGLSQVLGQLELQNDTLSWGWGEGFNKVLILNMAGKGQENLGE